MLNLFKKESRILETALLLALSFSLCVGTWASGRSASISEKLVRLHILAVSDDEAEQAVKLQVRDRVLAYLNPLLTEVDSREEAEKVIRDNMDGIAEAAAAAAGSRKVTVSLSDESYPTKDYGGFTLPAGKYSSLRVILGEGKGHNWWCVVFPPLCTSVTGADSMKSVMNADDYSIITEQDGYTLKFRTLELWGKLNGLIAAKS